MRESGARYRRLWEEQSLITRQRGEETDPYVIPAMVHFLKFMTLQVRVPVLSEKRYFTCERRGEIRGEMGDGPRQAEGDETQKNNTK